MEAASIKDRAEAGEGTEPEEDAQLFPIGQVEGDGLSLAKFRKAGKDVHAHVKIKAVRAAGGRGLADPEKVRTLLVTVQPGKAEEIPHMREGAIDHYENVQHYTPTYVEGVQRGDAGRLEASFLDLLHTDSKGAAKALDAMQRRASEVIGS